MNIVKLSKIIAEIAEERRAEEFLREVDFKEFYRVSNIGTSILEKQEEISINVISVKENEA